jgi:alkylation response protein AidB-like acyl-CoA dehydrogenase
MDFRFAPEEEAFRREVQAFIEEHRDRFVLESSESGKVEDGQRNREFVRAMAARGWLAMSYPAEYGGGGQPGIFQFILNEELAERGAPMVGMGPVTIGLTLLHHGSEALKRAFIPRILRGEIEFALGYTEPEAGSDLASLQLRAERDGDFYVLNGQKRFTSGARGAEYVWLAARTNPEAPKHRGISLFIVDLDSPGITIRPLNTMGDTADLNEVYYEDVRVPAGRLVGQEDRGWYYITEALDYERFALFPYGRVRMNFRPFLEWLRTAERDGRPVREEPTIRHKAARLAIEEEVGWLLQLRAIAIAARGGVPNVEATMNKLFATQLIQRIDNVAVDSMGLYGQLKHGSKYAPADGYLEWRYRREVVATIAGGSTEVQKNVIARRLLNLPG